MLVTTTPADPIRTYTLVGSPTSLIAIALLECSVSSGGSLTSLDVGCKLLCADGTDDYEIEIRLTTTGFRAVDANNGGATIATVTVDMTSPLQIWVHLDAGTLAIWYRRPGAIEWSAATTAYALTSDTGSPAANGTISWGGYAASTSSTWRIVGVCFRGHLADEPEGAFFSRPISTRPAPLPDAGDGPGYRGSGATGRMAFLSAHGGPGVIGEEWRINARYAYPAEATIPGLSPSPADTWRSVDETEQYLIHDLDQAAGLGVSRGLFVANANFRTAYLEYVSGAAWVTDATLDLATDFTSLSYVLSGQSLGPANSGNAAGRYIAEGELVGGHVILDPGGTPKYRSLQANTAGWWQSSDTYPRPDLTLDGIDGTEGASGTCHLVAPTGIVVVHDTARTTARYWRWRVPAQGTPDGYLEAGIITALRIQSFGGDAAWGSSSEVAPNARTTRSRYGTTRVREDGPPVDTWSIVPPPEVRGGIRSGTMTDYVGASGYLPLAAQHDTLAHLRGILEATNSGEQPVVALREIPTTSGTTVTDRSLLLYGRLGGSIRATLERGTFGVDELLRGDPITVAGIP